MAADTDPTLVLPPTPPAPAAEARPVAFVTVNPRIDVLPQIQERAEALGRENLEGFAYEQGGVHYVVTGDETHHPIVAVKHERAILPSFTAQNRDLTRDNHYPNARTERRERPLLSRVFPQIGGAYKLEHQVNEDGTDYVTLKGYGPDRSLVSRVRLTADEFADFLNTSLREPAGRSRVISNMRFLELAPDEETENRTVTVDISDRSKPILEAVMETAEHEGLPDLIGLTWTRDGYPRRIVDDYTRSGKSARGHRALREWVVETRNPSGQITSTAVMNGEQLGHAFEVMNTPPNAPLNDLRFEVPRTAESDERERREYWDERELEVYGLFGWLATGMPEDPPVGEELSRDEASELLSYADIYPADSSEPETIAERVRLSMEGDKQIKGLQAIVYEVGAEALDNMARRMLQQYEAALHHYGIVGAGENMSLSWVMEELGMRRYLADNPHEADEARASGIEVDNPAGNNAAARMTRRNIVDERVGLTYATAMLEQTEKPAKQVVKIPESERVPGGDEYKEAIRGEITVRVRDETQLLQTSIKDEVNELLTRGVLSRKREDVKPLTRGNFARIGELLGRATAERLLN